MAMMDYRLCDVCGSKAFYDANLNYADTPSPYFHQVPFRENGAEQPGTPEERMAHALRLDFLGDWSVICANCAKTHKCAVIAIQQERA